MPEPSHRSKHVGAQRPETIEGWKLTIDGLVEEPRTLGLAELRALPGARELTSKVDCPDGIGTRGASFEGLPLQSLIDLARPAPEAAYVCVQSGPFTASFSLESLGRRGSILALSKSGLPLQWDDGGPVRLIVEKGACFDTVKWVERISLDVDDSKATAVSIVRARRQPESS